MDDDFDPARHLEDAASDAPDTDGNLVGLLAAGQRRLVRQRAVAACWVGVAVVLAVLFLWLL